MPHRELVQFVPWQHKVLCVITRAKKQRTANQSLQNEDDDSQQIEQATLKKSTRAHGLKNQVEEGDTKLEEEEDEEVTTQSSPKKKSSGGRGAKKLDAEDEDANSRGSPKKSSSGHGSKKLVVDEPVEDVEEHNDDEDIAPEKPSQKPAANGRSSKYIPVFSSSPVSQPIFCRSKSSGSNKSVPHENKQEDIPESPKKRASASTRNK